ncbi:MAG: heparinase II/III-family protein, partial [Candidatus Latescibacterota bacterium]
GQNQSEVWGAHRCARRAHPLFASLSMSSDGSLVFEGAHDGYRRLDGKPVHRRRIVWKGTSLNVEDSVEGTGIHKIQARLHFHPDLNVFMRDGRAVVEEQGQRLLTVSLLGQGVLELTKGIYCPEFGLVQPCAVIQITVERSALPFFGGWQIELDEIS